MSDLTSALEEFGLPGFLRELNSVLIALLDRDGRVLAGNCGFLRLVAPTAALDRAWDARDLLINPRLEDIQTFTSYHGGTLLLYRGILDIADENGRGRSLQGHIYRWREGRLLVAAEFDVEGLEMLGATVLRLNEELAETQQQLLRANRELKRNESVIQELMNTDPLTGVGNRRRLNEALAAEVERSRRHAHPFCLLIVDLDHFKDVNDRHGYAAGDEALKSFAVLLREHSRQSDQVTRFGSEEFVLLLPDTVLESAVAFAERIRQRLAWQPIALRSERITASFGVAMLAENEKGEELLRRADVALRRSKREGRNRITQAIAPGQNAASNVRAVVRAPSRTGFGGHIGVSRFSKVSISCWPEPPEHGGKSLYSYALGTGPDVVLVHGWGMHSGIWQDVAEALCDRYRITVVDLPGHGFSRFLEARHSLDELCAAVMAAVPTPAIWVGWSLGGLVAQRAAIVAPERIDRLVLANSTPCFAQRPDWPHGIALPVLRRFAEELRENYRAVLKRFIALEVHGSERATAQLHLLKAMLFQHGEPAVSALEDGLTILESTDLRAEWPRIACPTLLLLGQRDQLVPAEAGVALLERLSNARLRVFERAGHAPFFSHLPDFVAELRAFLDA